MIPALAAAVILTGIPTASDGDNLRFGRVTTRLADIDAPEMPDSPKCRRSPAVWSCTPQARRFAVPARDRLRELTIRGVRCSGPDADQYERPVVRCTLPDGRDPARVLVREGLARPDLRFGGERYLADEKLARTLGRGAWAR